MTYTTNYNLKKPGDDDNLLVSASNDNMDVLDEVIKDIEDTTLNVDDFVTTAFDKVYPVNSIYISTSSVLPFTFGTWVAIQNKYLLCGGVDFPIGLSHNGTILLNKTQLPYHTHTFTPKGRFDAVDAHTHVNNAEHAFHIDGQVITYGANKTTTMNRVIADEGCTASIYDAYSQFYINTDTGEQSPETNNQVVVANKDTSEDGLHTHEFVGTHTETESYGLRNPITFTPKFIPVFIWKRTA